MALHLLLRLSLRRPRTKVSLRPAGRSASSVFGNKQSLYDLLGVSPAATQEAIKEAFFARSKEIHPDLHPDEPGAVEQFQHLAAAYEACFTEKFAFGKVADHMQYAIVLSDSSSRREYDMRIERKKTRDFGRNMTGWEAARKTEQQQEDLGQDGNERPRYGVDPAFGRRVDVDLSPERMAKAWEAYKARWEKEEEYRRQLEEKKLKFRTEFDKARDSNFSGMSEEDLLRLRVNMRHVRSSRLYRTNFSGVTRPGEEEEDGQSATSGREQEEDERRRLRRRQSGKEVAEKTRRAAEAFLGLDKESAEASKRQKKEEEENIWRPHEDPLLKGLGSSRSAPNFSRDARQAFHESVEHSKTRWKTVRENWKDSDFLGDSTGSSFGSGPYVSHELRISRWLVAALASLLAVMLVVDTFYKSNPEDTNEYLAELNRKEKEAATEAKAKEKREK